MSETPPLSAHPTPSVDRSRALEQTLARFEAALRLGQSPRIEEFLPTEPTERRLALIELVHTELEHRLKTGQRRLIGGYLQRFAELGANPDTVAELIVAEYRVVRRLDAAVRAEDYLSAYPAHADRVRSLMEREGRSGEAPRVEGYELFGILGRGGMGVVYKARHLALNRIVALKMVLAGEHADDEERGRLRREAEAAAQLQHPNIVQVFEVGEQHGRPFIALEYVGGGSLEQKIAGTPQPSLFAAQLVQTLARAVHHAHEHGVVHRDLKPGNVLLATDGTPKVTDFGLAKQLQGGPRQTQSGAVLGTPSYMAPEQAAGKTRRVGPLSDVYSLGAVLYEMLTGRPPFKAETSLDTLLQVIDSDPVAPRQLNPNCPRDLETICLKCLRKEPTDRYGSAAELADDLQRFLDGEPIKARPIGTGERAVRWLRKRPALMLGAVLALFTMIGVPGGIKLWQISEQRRSDYERIKRETDEQARIAAEARLEKTSHFASYLWRHGEAEGIGPLSEDEARRRHCVYRFVHKGGVLQRVEIVNGLGATFRGDVWQTLPAYEEVPQAGRRPGAFVFIRDPEHATLTQIEFRDHRGQLLWEIQQPLAEVSTIRMTAALFGEAQRNPVQFHKITWAADGLHLETRYLGLDRRPTMNANGVYGVRWSHNARGLPSGRTWLNADGQPTVGRDGVCTTRFEYDERGQCIAMSVHDVEGKPVVHATIGARMVLLRDDIGNEVERRFFDPMGQPLTLELGFQRRRLTYDLRGNWTVQEFLDATGRRVRTKDGVSFWRHWHDARGNTIAEVAFTPDDRPMQHPAGYSRRTMRFDERDNVIEQSYFSADGTPAIGPERVHRWTAVYDDRNRPVRMNYLDANGKPAAHPDGNYAWTSQYDAAGREVERTYLGADGKPSLLPAGFARITRTFNQRGEQASEAYWGVDGEPVLHRDGFHAWQRGEIALQGKRGQITVFQGILDQTAVHRDGYNALLMILNERGLPEETRFVLHDQPVLHREGYAMVRTKYDAFGHPTELLYFGLRGEPILTANGAARTTRRYDARGKLIEETQWVLDERGNYLRTEVVNDDAGREIEQRYVTTNGRPALHQDGYHRVVNRYDARGFLCEAAYFGLKDEPVSSRLAAHRRTTVNDEQGRVLEGAFFGSDGKPANSLGGYHRYTWKYDASGNRTEEAYFDAVGKRMMDSSGVARKTWHFSPQGVLLGETPWVLDVNDEYAWLKDLPSQNGRTVVLVNADHQPVLHKDGYARIVSRTDNKGRVIEVAYFGRNNEKVRIKDGYHRSTSKYDDHNLEIERRYFDENGNPTANAAGWSILTRDPFYDRTSGKAALNANEYHYAEDYLNTLGQRVRFAVFGINGEPKLHAKDRVHCWIHRLDAQGREVERICLGTSSEPVLHAQGYHRFTIRFDEQGNPVETAYFGIDGKPVIPNPPGWSRMSQSYNDKGRLVRTTYFGSDGQPMIGPHGYATLTTEYSADGLPESSEFLDAADRPLRAKLVLGPPPSGSVEEQLGLKEGDVLLRFDGKELFDPVRFLLQLKARPKDDPPRELTIDRAGKVFTVQLPYGPWKTLPRPVLPNAKAETKLLPSP